MLLGYSNPPGYIDACVVNNFVYYVPYSSSNDEFSSRLLRLDLTKSFTSAAAWQTFVVGNVSGLMTQGFYGCLTDNSNNVYFIPYAYRSGTTTIASGNHLKYDTTRNFTDPLAYSSWNSNPTNGLAAVGFKSGTFDGKYFFFSVCF